jgi:prepilin-type N-terminal cleavage/methylation domain-containing protein
MFLNRGQLTMSFTNIKNNNQGFTIVELLIVVVVIAILAAITIVSYNGITNKANASAAATTAASFQKKAELYAADDDGGGKYPTTLSALTNSAKSDKPYYVASGTIKQNATPTATTGKDTIKVEQCGTGAGLKITYYDYAAGSLPGTPQITLGTTTGTCAALGA